MNESTIITAQNSTAEKFASNLTAGISNLTNLINSTNEENIFMVSLPNNLLGAGQSTNQTVEGKIGTITIVIIVAVVVAIALILCLLWVCCCTKKAYSKKSSRRSKK